MQGRLRSIDLLRAVAACAVVLFHSSETFYLGAAGVDLFFVISGFVIASVSSGRSASEFLSDRASRIFPLYCLALLPWAVSAHAHGTLNWTDLAADILLLPRVLFDIQPLLLLSWTLVFELLFYCCAGASIRWGSAKPAVAAFLILMLAAWVTGAPQLKWVGCPIILEFLFGVLIYRAPKNARIGLAALIIGLAFLLTSPSISRNVFEFSSALGRVINWGIPSAFIVYGVVTFETRLTGPLVERLCWLGVASYSIYLFHPLPLGMVHGPWWARFLLGLAVGVVAWALCERSLENMRRQWRKKRKRVANGPVPPAGFHGSTATASQST